MRRFWKLNSRALDWRRGSRCPNPKAEIRNPKRAGIDAALGAFWEFWQTGTDAEGRTRVVSQNRLYQSRGTESGRGQPHSKTLRVFGRIGARASVLECGCPLPLWPASASVILRRHTGAAFRQPFGASDLGFRVSGFLRVSVFGLRISAPGRFFNGHLAGRAGGRQSNPYFSIHAWGIVPKLSSQSLNRRKVQPRPTTRRCRRRSFSSRPSQ